VRSRRAGRGILWSELWTIVYNGDAGPPMITLGVDLAADPKRTALCWIRWKSGTAEAYDAGCGADDEALLRSFKTADEVGIDAPFGWPDAFVEAVAAHHRGERWPTAGDKDLQYRATDREVHRLAKRWPLSVSSDRIGVTTMRAARIFSEMARLGSPVDRDGSGKLVEVYPAAALKRWGFNPEGYKGPENRGKRTRLLQEVETSTRSWLRLSDSVREQCVESDDVLDALVAALVARAAATGHCEPIPPAMVATARREGWIHLPQSGSLPLLATAPA
jgi:predicted nuclease with RNAse H fold